jgi:hypothetical protein
MIDDLVKRLRAGIDNYSDGGIVGTQAGIIREAADRIAALEAELERLKAPASDEELVIQIGDLICDQLGAPECKSCIAGPGCNAETAARAVLAAVAGKIEARGWNAALEAAAKVVDDIGWDKHVTLADVSATIRALSKGGA